MRSGEVLFFGTFLSGVAVAYLAWGVNLLTAVMAALAFSIYLYIYTPLKKISPFCTLAGAVAGALPPVIGWAAATGTLGIEALVLFGIIFFWQFPHFFSLAWLYKDDYAGAGLHMLPQPADHGRTAAVSMVLNSLALLIVSVLPTVLGLTGRVYFVAAAITGLMLLVPSVYFLFDRSQQHARRIFFASLLYVPVLVVFMVLNRVSPF
jgi:protoheme IX farnesyltransferase